MKFGAPGESQKCPTIDLREAEYCHALWTRPDWIRRRVDTYEPMDIDVVKLQMSFDLDAMKLQEYAKAHGRSDRGTPQSAAKSQNSLIPSGDGRFAVPLFSCSPNPILDISISANGKPQSICPRRASVRFSTAVMLWAIFEKLDSSTTVGSSTDFLEYYNEITNDIFRALLNRDMSNIGENSNNT